MLWKRIEGSAPWALRFGANQAVNFGMILRGECLLLRSCAKPLQIRSGDFLLLTKPATYTLASSEDVETTEDAHALFEASMDKHVRIGPEPDYSLKLTGGYFEFDSVNVDLLTDFLPPLIHMKATDEAAWRMRSVLELAGDEALSARPGPTWWLVA